MSMGIERLATLTIEAAAATSDALSDHLSAGQAKVVLGALEQMTIYGPAALTNAVKVEVSDTFPGVVWKDLEDYLGNGIAIEADKATGIPYTTFKDLRLLAAGNEASERTFPIDGKLNYT